MKGITPVIAVILLLLITIAMIGFAALWFQRIAGTATQAGEQQLGSVTANQAKTAKIDNAARTATSTSISIRNTGSQAIKNSELSFFVAGTQFGCDSDANAGNGVTALADIQPSGTATCLQLCTQLSGGTCTVGGQCVTGTSRVKVTAPGGFDEVTCA